MWRAGGNLIRIAFLDVSIDRDLWDNSTVYEPNASEDELICSARRLHCEPAGRARPRASNGQRTSRTRRGRFGPIVVPSLRFAGQFIGSRNAGARSLFDRRW